MTLADAQRCTTAQVEESPLAVYLAVILYRCYYWLCRLRRLSIVHQHKLLLFGYLFDFGNQLAAIRSFDMCTMIDTVRWNCGRSIAVLYHCNDLLILEILDVEVLAIDTHKRTYDAMSCIDGREIVVKRSVSDADAGADGAAVDNDGGDNRMNLLIEHVLCHHMVNQIGFSIERNSNGRAMSLHT